MDVSAWLLIVAVTALTLTAAICDYRTKKIPNRLTVPGFAAAVLFHVVVGALHEGWRGAGAGVLTSLAGFAVGFGILLVLWLIGGGGAGDVKLMGAVGAWLGPKNALIVFLVSTVLVAALSIGVLLFRFVSQSAARTRRYLLPYGIPVALATWLVLAWTFRTHWLAH